MFFLQWYWKRIFGDKWRPVNDVKALKKQSTAAASESFLYLPLDSWQKWRCSLYAGSTMPVLFLSRPWSEGWPHYGLTFSIYLYPLSFWLTLPQRVLSTTWCCLSRPCVIFLACVHLALFLALFLSPGNSLVSSWCDHSMLASVLWQCLSVPSLLQLCWEPTHLFSLLFTKHAESFSVFSSQRPQDVILHSSWVSSFHNASTASQSWMERQSEILQTFVELERIDDCKARLTSTCV